MMIVSRYYFKVLIALILPITGIFFSFQISTNDLEKSARYKTENVIILIIDGPRYSETFGDSSCQYIPNLSKILAPQGVLIHNFRNEGSTYTNSGHTAITTGDYQRVKNDGSELPNNPGIFHYFLKEKGYDSTQAWIIASKGKLNILGKTKDRKWRDQYMPSTYCGIDGKGEGYTADKYNWRDAQIILSKYHPKLTLINLLEADVKGHQNLWDDYLKAIRNTDAIAKELWDFIQNDSIYRDKTTLFITNDHGRHLDGHKDGFVSHGDRCEGCRTMYLVALGPDFKKNVVLENKYEQIDISKTIALLLDFNIPTSKGVVMEELFLTSPR